MPEKNLYDAVVVGGGPGGATTATVLAQHDRRVLLLERDTFPRYHVGESLMPYTWFTFERLGVLDWFEKAACPRKRSVQFVSTTGKVSQPFLLLPDDRARVRHDVAGAPKRLRPDDA